MPVRNPRMPQMDHMLITRITRSQMTNLWNICACWKISMNPFEKRILPFLSYAGILMQGLLCIGKVILRIMRGRLFNNFLISNNLEQLINEHTYVRDDGAQSCIDLICTDQPFTFMETGVCSSLDPCSKHNIIHSTININIPLPPPAL